jgi:hypothetical protein
MANHAYASFWCREFPESRILGLLGKLLGTVPAAGGAQQFTSLVVRAVDATETPVVEHDLRGQGVTPTDIIALAREHLHADSCYEVQALWDVWVLEGTEWGKRPQRVEIVSYAEEYDGGVFADAGHFQIDLGFEHLFTGHAGLLGFGSARAGPPDGPRHPAEAVFLAHMADPGNLRTYQEKTRENVRGLLDWMQAVQVALPIEKFRLWSEGEENFEARLDEILALG